MDGTGTVRVRWRVNKVRSGISDSYQGTFRYTGPYQGYVPAVPREPHLQTIEFCKLYQRKWDDNDNDGIVTVHLSTIH